MNIFVAIILLFVFFNIQAAEMKCDFDCLEQNQNIVVDSVSHPQWSGHTTFTCFIRIYQ